MANDSYESHAPCSCLRHHSNLESGYPSAHTGVGHCRRSKSIQLYERTATTTDSGCGTVFTCVLWIPYRNYTHSRDLQTAKIFGAKARYASSNSLSCSHGSLAYTNAHPSVVSSLNSCSEFGRLGIKEAVDVCRHGASANHGYDKIGFGPVCRR